MKNSILYLFLLLCTTTSIAQTTSFVKPAATGTGDGSSWANASDDLQAMIDAATDQVFVAVGTYKPNRKADATGTITPNDRDNAFVLRPNIKVYGGFDPDNGIDDLSDTRILPTSAGTGNGSILSGDLGVQNDTTGNAYHVVVGIGNVGTARLDGFTVKDGNATGSGSLTINGVLSVSRNGGGGINSRESSPTFANLIISDNYALNGGGGMSCPTNASPTLINVLFSKNVTQDRGGGMMNTGNSSPVLINVTFSENSVARNAGSTGSIRGGGLYNGTDSSPTLINVTFIGNSAVGTANNVRGGGMYNLTNSSPTLTNVVFTENTAPNGGAIHNESSSPTLTNTTISRNSATTGGAIFNRGSSFPKLYNTIIWDNTATTNPGINNINTSAPDIQFSLVQDIDNSANGGLDGTTTANDPQFVDAANNNYRLQSTSPAVDTGSNALLPVDNQDLDNDANITENIPLDLARSPRETGDKVDLGAYEFNTSLPVNFGAFNAFIKNNILTVNWMTEQEVNNAFFTVEVSENGVSFIALDTIKTKALNGNSSIRTAYQYETGIPNWASLLALPLLFASFGAGFFKRRKIAAVAAFLLIMTALVAGCRKEMYKTPSPTAKVYVRITQTDIDGAVKYSKVVLAVMKD